MIKKSKIILFLAGFILMNSAFSNQKFMSIADIHFDPFLECQSGPVPCPLIQKLRDENINRWETIFKENANPEPSKLGKNTNFALLQSSLTEMGRVEQQDPVRFVLVLGDLLAHQMQRKYIKFSDDKTQQGYEDFIKKTLGFLTQSIKQKFPHADIYLVLGNNDSYTGDYSVIVKGKFLQDLSELGSTLIADSNNRKEFAKDFSANGYYSILIPGTHHRLIVLNTVLFSTHAIESLNETAAQELVWLDNQLKQAEKDQEQVWLVEHVPMGIDVFTTVNRAGWVHTFWQEEYTKKFREILDHYPNTITAIIPGHIHKDAFQLLPLNSTTEIPVTYTPSISPIYQNNPGFKVYDYDDTTFKLTNFDVYYLDLNASTLNWKKEYNFDALYQADCQTCDLLQGFKKLNHTEELKKFYEDYFMVNVHQRINSMDNLNYFICGINQYTSADYKNCLRDKGASIWSRIMMFF